MKKLRTLIESIPPWILFSTLNINSYYKYGWAQRQHLCTDIVSKMPDMLFGFQEFAKYCVEQFQAKRPNLKFVLSKKMFDIHNAIGYDSDRLKLLGQYTLPLSPTGKVERAWDAGPRTALFATFLDMLTGKEILMVNFHLDHISKLARNNGIDLILKELQKFPKGTIIIITADANTSVDSPYAKWHELDMSYPYRMMMEAGFLDCWRKGNPKDSIRKHTYHGFHGHNYIIDEFGTWDTDWCMVNDELEVLGCERIATHIGTLYPSDHFFVSALTRYSELKAAT